MHLVYLHGFASSPRSSKAAFFSARAAARGIPLLIPDFNQPDFAGLTITRMLTQVAGVIAGLPGPVALIGSSLGGFVAVQAALQHPQRIERLALLAPALDFSGNRLRELGHGSVEEWRTRDALPVFHYGLGRVMTVRFELYADAARYDAGSARPEVPMQIFQGRRDETVRPETVERWSSTRPNVELHLLDDDHQLLASLPTIWQDMERFLFPAPPGGEHGKLQNRAL